MKTRLDLAGLAADPQTAETERILRTCVRCGLCLPACPTYLLTGDERDSPRGRIRMIGDMLRRGDGADAATTRHVDRCLSCLSCTTACPSGVDYMHLVDRARAHIQETRPRPPMERFVRRLIALVVPRRRLFRLAAVCAMPARRLGPLLPAPLARLAEMAPRRLPPRSRVDRPAVHAARGERRMRVALLNGCAQQTLAPEIDEATVRLLTRLGCEAVVAGGSGCCGALTLHMGEREKALAAARANLAAWKTAGPFDAVVANASGCGTQLKEYGFLLRDDPDWAGVAAEVSRKARDVSEVAADLMTGGAAPADAPTVAYHAACSLRHGQRIVDEPAELLRRAGFAVREIPEGHICCGSAGTYNMLQPEMAARLLARKCENIEATGADAVAAGNIGCMVQIAAGLDKPVLHPVQLLDWASGGPKPEALRNRP